MSIQTTMAALFTLDQINAELKTQGIKGQATTIEVAVAAIIKVRKIQNLDGFTALYLDLKDRVDTKELQSLLDAAGAKSPNAAGNRVCMQRYPDKYGVKPQDRARRVPASTRTGKLTEISLEGDAAAELAKLLK
jgi:hypothetical protein